jgi:hypothetical protein
MNLIKRDEIKRRPLPGRVIQLVVGKQDAASPSDVMTMGFAHYSAESGPMSPHRHVEEVVFVLESTKGYVRFGGTGDQPTELGERIPLEVDMLMHFPENEWHVFEYEPGGHISITFFYCNPNVYTGQGVAK